jgi:hypothetical protein
MYQKPLLSSSSVKPSRGGQGSLNPRDVLSRQAGRRIPIGRVDIGVPLGTLCRVIEDEVDPLLKGEVNDRTSAPLTHARCSVPERHDWRTFWTITSLMSFSGRQSSPDWMSKKWRR